MWLPASYIGRFGAFSILNVIILCVLIVQCCCALQIDGCLCQLSDISVSKYIFNRYLIVDFIIIKVVDELKQTEYGRRLFLRVYSVRRIWFSIITCSYSRYDFNNGLQFNSIFFNELKILFWWKKLFENIVFYCYLIVFSLPKYMFCINKSKFMIYFYFGKNIFIFSLVSFFVFFIFFLHKLIKIKKICKRDIFQTNIFSHLKSLFSSFLNVLKSFLQGFY